MGSRSTFSQDDTAGCHVCILYHHMDVSLPTLLILWPSNGASSFRGTPLAVPAFSQKTLRCGPGQPLLSSFTTMAAISVMTSKSRRKGHISRRLAVQIHYHLFHPSSSLVFDLFKFFRKILSIFRNDSQRCSFGSCCQPGLRRCCSARSPQGG